MHGGKRNKRGKSAVRRIVLCANGHPGEARWHGDRRFPLKTKQQGCAPVEMADLETLTLRLVRANTQIAELGEAGEEFGARVGAKLLAVILAWVGFPNALVSRRFWRFLMRVRRLPLVNLRL